MYPSNRLIGSALAVAAVLLNGCVTDGSTTKAGGDAEPITLRIGTDDGPGSVAANQIVEFARQVERLSDREIRIEPVLSAAHHQDDWDQRVARMVVGGELDLGLIPARAWDTEGVDTMRALNAPFLITSDELMDRVVADDELTGGMFAGLEPIGVSGLALLPDGLRHVFSFGAPLVQPADFEGMTIRAPASETTYAVFEALGANPDDLAMTAESIGDGSLGAVESSFAIALTLPVPAPTTAVGNMTLFPRINALVVNSDVLSGLTDGQQNVLRDAALETRDWAVDANIDDVAQAETYCDGGGTIVLANDAEIEAIHLATESVYDELERDPSTAAMIDRIRELEADVEPAAEVAECVASVPEATVPTDATSSAPAEADEPVSLDGVYRFEFTAEQLVAVGVPEDIAYNNQGRHTLGLDGGDFYDEVLGGYCRGTYEIDGDRVTFRWDFPPAPSDDECTGDWAATATIDSDQVTWSDVEALPPHDNPIRDLLLLEALYGSPWTRIDDIDGPDTSTVESSTAVSPESTA